ncbi:19658_t:CDS:2, partial [Racocetra fulgida]
IFCLSDAKDDDAIVKAIMKTGELKVGVENEFDNGSDEVGNVGGVEEKTPIFCDLSRPSLVTDSGIVAAFTSKDEVITGLF